MRKVRRPKKGLTEARLRDQCFSSQQGIVALQTKSSGLTTTFLKSWRTHDKVLSFGSFRSTFSSLFFLPIIPRMYFRFI